MSNNIVGGMNNDWDLSVQNLQQIARRDYRRNNLYFSLQLIRHILIILAAVFVSEIFHFWFVYIVAVMLIGAHQLGLGHIGYHERTHGLISKDPIWNDRIGAILIHIVGGNVIMGYDNFRPRHLTHHRYLNTNLDPDAWAPRAIASTPLNRHLFDFILILSGVAYLRLLIGFILKNLKFQRYRTVVGLGFATLTIYYGLFTGFYPMKLLVLYWIIPATTWCYFCFYVRSYAEHQVVDCNAKCPPIIFTREIKPTWFDRFFLATSGFSYHLSHHIAPFVPFYHLHRVHEQAIRDSSIRKKMMLYNGYHHLLFAAFRSHLNSDLS